MTALIPLEGTTPTSLTLPPNLSYDEWARTGLALARMGRAVQWWLGDWLMYGEQVHGEAYAQAATETGYSEDSLKNFQWVASRIAPEIRRLNLSWSAHQVVAATDDPARWLATAEDEGWSVRQLREAVQGPRKPKVVCGHPDCPMREDL